MGAGTALRLGRRLLVVGLSLAVTCAGVVFNATPASAVTFSNACVNSAVPTDATQLDVTLTGSAPASVQPGASFQLTSISQTLFLPGTLFLAGYNLGLLQVGTNTVPGTIKDVIEGTNTVEGTQTTPIAPTSITFTITDPDGVPGTGDETATDAQVSVNYPDQTWTAGPAGAIQFREDTVTPLSTTVGGIVITVTIGGFLTVRFGCDPGTVGPGGTTADITLIDPAATFASTTSLSGGNHPPTANAGPDQTVASGATVTLSGTASSDPDNDPLTYLWTQSSGPAVTLSGANTAMATFTAPTGPATLTFNLQVCDPSNACGTDSVTVTVLTANHPPTANAGPDQTVASGATVTLSGTASSDPDNDPLTYAWMQTSGPGVTLSGANTATASFTAPTGPATLTFNLQVCDPSKACGSDSVTIIVLAAVSDTTAPVVTLVSLKVQGPDVTVYFTATDVDNRSSDLYVSCLIVGVGGGQCYNTFTATLPSGFYHLEIQATDPAGNSTVLDVYFTIKSQKIKA